MEWVFELVAGPYGGTTEGPAWDGNALLFSHIPGNRILRYDPNDGTCTEYHIDTHATNGLMFDAHGNLYGCQQGQRCIAHFARDGNVTRLPNTLNGGRINRPNDLAIDRKGRVWFTDRFGSLTAEQREIDHASVLRLDPQADGSWVLKRMTTDTEAPNGILFSPDERTLYVAESGDNNDRVRELRAYPLQDDDTLGAASVLHTFGKDIRGFHRGIDGMCLDIDGNIIACAGWRTAGPGPMIYVFAPSGRVLETHPLPADKPTNCTFGDANLNSLYVTTGGGHLYRVLNTGHRGCVAYPR